MTTEVVCFPLRGARSLQGEQALKGTLSLLTSQAGFERAYWGWQEELNSNVFWVLVDWTSIEAHQEFQKQDYYMPFVEKLDQIADVSKLQAFHAQLSPRPAGKALNDPTSPITEISTFHFPANYSAEDKNTFEQNVLHFVANIEMHVATSTGFAGGWAAEKVPLPGSSEQTTIFIACLGWQSVEAHFAFRETNLFKDNEHLWSNAKDVKNVHTVHISAIQVNRGGEF